MSDIDLPVIPEGKKALLNANMYTSRHLMPQFKTYLSNRLLEYFKKNPSQDPDMTELSLRTKSDLFLANIFLSKDENGKRWYISDKNILNAVEEVIQESNATDDYKNAGLIYILRVIIYIAYVNDSSLANQELQEYIDNWKEPTGGKKTRKYKKRKNKKSKTNKNKKRKTKKRARQIY